MGKIFITSANDVDATFYPVTLSGGGWQSALPLDNLKSPRLIEVARSLSVALDHTFFTVDLGAVRETRLVCVPKGNFSRLARWRVRAFDTLGGFDAPLADSGWLDIFPVIYPYGSLPWGHKSWTDGRMTGEEASQVTMPAVHLFPSSVYARYWRLDFDDRQNPAGYLDLARLFISPGYQPTYNALMGASQGYETQTQVLTSLGGVDHFLVKDGREIFRFTLVEPEAEAMVWLRDMCVRLGRHGQVYVMLNSDDNEHRHRRSKLCNTRSCSGPN